MCKGGGRNNNSNGAAAAAVTTATTNEGVAEATTSSQGTKAAQKDAANDQDIKQQHERRLHQQDFYWEYNEEPHASRRKAILAKYPEIKELFGHDPGFKYVVGVLLTIQISTAYYVATAASVSPLTFFTLAYVIGGTCNHMLMLALHELSHNLGFQKPIHNRIFSLVANLPIGIPAAITFKRYHIEHHKYQGEDIVDTDIPSALEGRIIGHYTIMKLLFVIFQGAFYGLRPLMVSPKQPGVWELCNTTVCVVFDAAIYYLLGWPALLYLVLGTFLGSGLHPVAGHFISEHYVFVEGAETYSYYGPLNALTFNVGYHNEHHDFPFVAGRNLPKVRAMAREFYDTLPHHDSWVKVIYDYITDPEMSPYSRVKRHQLSAADVNKLK